MVFVFAFVFVLLFMQVFGGRSVFNLFLSVIILGWCFSYLKNIFSCLLYHLLIRGRRRLIDGMWIEIVGNGDHRLMCMNVFW